MGKPIKRPLCAACHRSRGEFSGRRAGSTAAISE
jgi:hypothetical protein